MVQLLNRYAFRLLTAWLVLLSCLYSWLSIIRHNHFQSGAFDLGVYDQEIWQYSQLLYPYNTIKERFILGDHLNLTTPLLAPLFWLWDDVRALLIFQAVWLAFSSIAIYKLCLLRRLSAAVGLGVTFVYSFFYGIQQAVFFEFHAVIIGVGLLAWLAYFLESGRNKTAIVITALLLLTQENMGIALAGLGLVYVFRKPFRKTGMLFVLIGIFYSLAAARLIAQLSPAGFQYQPEISFSISNNLTAMFNSPEKQQVWLYSLSWFSFLPIFSPGAMLATMLDLAQYFASGPEFSRMWTPFQHHRAILAVFLVLGVIEVLEFGKNRRIKTEWVGAAMVLFALGVQYRFHFPLNKLAKPIYRQEEAWMRDNREIFKQIPKGVSLATQQSLVPHLSHRREIYLLWPRIKDFETGSPCGQKSCWWLDYAGKPEYLLVDLHPNQWLTQLLESNENFGVAVANMERQGRIGLAARVNFARLYRINQQTDDNN